MRKHFFIIFMPLFFLSINTLFGQITMTNEGQLFIRDNQVVYVGGHFVNKSTAFYNRGNFSLTGNFWNEAKVGNSGYGILRFVGGQEQTFFVYDSLDVFDLEIDNDAGLVMAGDYSVRIFNEMNFLDGIVYTNANSLLAFQPESSYPGGADDFSHINGPAIRRGVDDFIFPIGKGGYLRQSGIQDLIDTTTFLSEYFNYAYSDLSIDNTLYRVSDEEFWNVERLNGTSDASVLLNYDEDIGGFDKIEDVQMAFYDNPWTKVESVYNGGSPTYFVSNDLVSKFGIFTFAENKLAQPAITFEVYQDEDCANVLNWVIPANSRIETFEIELSLDSINFVKIGEEQGDSIPFPTFKIYEYRDYELYEEKTLYYRVKMIQPGGAVYYTEVIALDNKCAFADCSIFPNPVRSDKNLTLRMSSEFEQTLNLRIYDVPGRILSEQEVHIRPGNHEYEIVTKDLNLASAMYFLEITKRKSLKFVVIFD